MPEGENDAENEAVLFAIETFESYGLSVPQTFGDVFTTIISEAKTSEETLLDLRFEDSLTGQDTAEKLTDVVVRHLFVIQSIAVIAAPRE